MFFELVRRNVLSAFLTRLGGVVFVVVFLHLPDGHRFITHRAQLYVTNTVALVKVKGPHIDGTLAAGREREGGGGKIILNLYGCMSIFHHLCNIIHSPVTADLCLLFHFSDLIQMLAV